MRITQSSMINEITRDAEKRGRIPNKTAESHVYEPQPWFYNREAPPLVSPVMHPCGERIVHDPSMCLPYGLFRIFGADGVEIKRQLSHP